MTTKCPHCNGEPHTENSLLTRASVCRDVIKSQCNALRDERDRLLEVDEQLRGLIAESGGVYGLHLNGDDAPWDWLINNGWLEALVAKELA